MAEIMLIAVVALVVLGPNKLPDAARQAGRALAELRKISNGFQREMQEAMREVTPTLPPLPSPAETTVQAASVDPSKPRRRRGEPLQARESAEEQLREPE
jgi:Sec-independent protein translocase protein TatA